MSDPFSLEQLREKLISFHQQHVLQFWDELSSEEQEQLAIQLGAIDFERIRSLTQEAAQQQSGAEGATAIDWASLARQSMPPPAVRIADRQIAERKSEAIKRGQQALANGEVGVLLVAGGQGSRLGYAHPKGMYPIGPVSGASLLEIHLQKALAIGNRYGRSVPVYLMNSPATETEQNAFLKENQRFGLAEDDLFTFCQGTMPAVAQATGKLLLADRGRLFLSPDGHGGTIAALAKSGAIDHMRARGIKTLFYLQVDNPLVPICDAEMIGYHLLAQSELTSMAVAKISPQDKLGNFVSIDGQVQVIEYSDFPDDVAEQQAADGSLKFWAGSIAVHVFDVAMLEKSLDLSDALPFHIARKAVPTIDDHGNAVTPSEPNALKFERFIFDLLPHAQNAIVVEYAEEEAFAPLKNGPGAERDTAEFVQRYMLAQQRKWLEAAGCEVADGVSVEISPLWAVDQQAVAERVTPGRQFVESTVLK